MQCHGCCVTASYILLCCSFFSDFQHQYRFICYDHWMLYAKVNATASRHSTLHSAECRMILLDYSLLWHKWLTDDKVEAQNCLYEDYNKSLNSKDKERRGLRSKSGNFTLQMELQPNKTSIFSQTLHQAAAQRIYATYGIIVKWEECLANQQVVFGIQIFSPLTAMNQTRLPIRAFLSSHTPSCTCLQAQLRRNAVGNRDWLLPAASKH